MRMRDKLDLAPAAPAHLSGSCRTPLVPALLSEGTNGVLLKTGTKHMKLITNSLTDKLLANGRAQRAAMDKGDDALDFKVFFVCRAVRASCSRSATASQRRDSDSPLGLRPLPH